MGGAERTAGACYCGCRNRVIGVQTQSKLDTHFPAEFYHKDLSIVALKYG